MICVILLILLYLRYNNGYIENFNIDDHKDEIVRKVKNSFNGKEIKTFIDAASEIILASVNEIVEEIRDVIPFGSIGKYFNEYMNYVTIDMLEMSLSKTV